MQGDRNPSDASRLQRRQQRRREMQPGGRCGNRAFVLREHGLVVRIILRRRSADACDIRRQRERPGAPKCRGKRLAVERKCQRHAAILLTRPHRRRKIVGAVERQFMSPARSRRALRASACQVPSGQRPVERDADAGGATAGGKLRRDHPRVVDHQHIAGAQQRGQIANDAVVQSIRGDVQQPRRITRPRRMLCDAVGRLWSRKNRTRLASKGIRPARARAGVPHRRRECSPALPRPCRPPGQPGNRGCGTPATGTRANRRPGRRR